MMACRETAMAGLLGGRVNIDTEVLHFLETYVIYDHI